MTAAPLKDAARAALRGFTLLEVLFALALLAIMMFAVSSLTGTTNTLGADIANLTTATQVVHGVVMDIEQEFFDEPFSTNDVEGRDCKEYLPREMSRFDCEYDLFGLDIGSDNIVNAGAQAVESVTGSPLMTAICGGGAGGEPPKLEPGQDPQAMLLEAGVSNAGAMGALAQLLDPAFGQLCGMNIAKMCQNTPLIASFIPTIIENAAKVTRKLVIRLSWAESGGASRELRIETFITSLAASEEEAEGSPL